jgi:hypothetical protein
MKHPRPDLVDLSAESTITIQPDGRIYAFGITRPLVELLAAIPTSDERNRRLLDALKEAPEVMEAAMPPEEER